MSTNDDETDFERAVVALLRSPITSDSRTREISDSCSVDRWLSVDGKTGERYQAALAAAIDGPTDRHVLMTSLPHTLGRYRLGRVLGSGAMGVVVEATEVASSESADDRPLAVKLLRPDLAVQTRVRDRFLREARSVGSLHHPGIVPIHHSGQQDEWYFHVMDRIDGGSIAELLAELRRTGQSSDLQNQTGPEDRITALARRYRSASHPQAICVTEVLRMVLSVARTLLHAHENHIVHRDIKPSNLLVDLEGRVLVSDFGLAGLKMDVNLTASNQFLGTLRYSGFEQLNHSNTHYDVRWDISSLGLTLYEMITGRPAWDGATPMAILQQARRGKPPTIQSQVPAAPGDIDWIFARCLGCQSVEPYQTIEALCDDLTNVLEHRSLQRPRWYTGPVRRWTGRIVKPLLSFIVFGVAMYGSRVLAERLIASDVASPFVLSKNVEEVSSSEAIQFDGWSVGGSAAGTRINTQWIDLWPWVDPGRVHVGGDSGNPMDAAERLTVQSNGALFDGRDTRLTYSIPLDLTDCRELLVRMEYEVIDTGNSDASVDVRLVRYHDAPPVRSVSCSFDFPQSGPGRVTLVSLENVDPVVAAEQMTLSVPEAAVGRMTLVVLPDQTEAWIDGRRVLIAGAVGIQPDHLQLHINGCRLRLTEWQLLPLRPEVAQRWRRAERR